MQGFYRFATPFLRSIEVVDPIAEILFHLVADDFHRTVDQSVLLGEWLVHDSQSRRKPPLGKFSGIGAAGPVTVDLRAEDVGGRSRSTLPDIAGVELAAQGVAIGYDDRPGEGLWLL